MSFQVYHTFSPDMVRFQLCGKLVRNNPGLKVEAAFIKKRAGAFTKGWDDEVDDVPSSTILKEVITSARTKRPSGREVMC